MKVFVAVWMTLICSFALSSFAAAQVAHPLDPLTKDEIALAAQTLKAYDKFPSGGRFPTIVLHEPPKAEVRR